MNHLSSKFLAFASYVLDGKEGAFFTDGNECFFDVGDAKKVSFDDKVFPIFSAFDFKGEGDSFFFGNEDFSNVKEEQIKEISKKFDSYWLDSPPLWEECAIENEESFTQKVQIVQEAQRNGEMWVLNLTHPLSGPLDNPEILLASYFRFLQENKLHVGGVFWTKDLKFASFSPELFLKQDQDILMTCPIKGTGEKKTLVESQKEESELSMVTDLLRNDLGQICEEVWVDQDRVLVNHDSFFHTHAEIKGRMKGVGLSLKDYKTLLPAGSISGCPKKRVCEYIDRLEGYDRDYYTGTFGVKISEEKSIFNILIRTIFVDDKTWRFPVGAGITHESDPKQEWEETLAKIEYLSSYIFRS